MKKEQAVRMFEETHRNLYLERVDYWTGQLAWSSFVDSLCKDGQITEKQYNNWSTPFPYGKHLKPKQRMYVRFYQES